MASLNRGVQQTALYDPGLAAHQIASRSAALHPGKNKRFALSLKPSGETAELHVIAPDLPAHLKAALARLGEDPSRRETAARAARISSHDRGGGTSRGIADATAALAYAYTRMPATYAAVSAAAARRWPGGAGSSTAIAAHVGAGPGTASWCAATAFSSLQNFTLLDSNPALHELAMALARDAHRFPALAYRLGNASHLLDDAAPLIPSSRATSSTNSARRSGAR